MKFFNSIGQKLRNLILPVLALFVLACCEFSLEPDPSRDFVIRKGEHYASPRLFERFETRKLSFKATFDESARYTLDDPAMQSNKNKLMGFSDCRSLHHENSARFGWQWYNERLEIYAYSYVDSIRIEKFIATVELNQENLYEIVSTDQEYLFYLNGEKRTSIERSSVCEEGMNYVLYPYFGGSVPAPHDVRIKIEMVK